MFDKFLRFCLVAIIAVSFLVNYSPSAKAAGESSVAGIIISPPLTEKEVQPGASVNGVIKITNPNPSTDLKIDVTISDFKANGEDGEQTFVDPVSNASFSLGTWISIDSTFNLAANETKQISYNINVPANAEPGGHYGVIFFSPSISQSSTSLSGSGVTAIPKVGSLFLLNVPGDIKYNGNIEQFSANKKLFTDSKSVVDFVTRFQNLGTTHVKPQGNIVITNSFGKEVTTLQVNDKMGNVLPDSIRRFENSWEKKYGFGFYKATVNLAFGESSSASSTLTFWIIPWKETAGAIVILLILIWILSHLRWGGKGKNNQTPLTPQEPSTPPTPGNEPPVPPTNYMPSTPPVNQDSQQNSQTNDQSNNNL